MRRRGAAALAAAAALAGCGGGRAGPDEDSSGALRWRGTPLVFRATRLPSDRVLIGGVRNGSRRSLRLVAARLRVLDARGAALRAFAQFSDTYAHGLYGAYQKPRPLPPRELSRLGFVITLPPGGRAPLSVAFRLTQRTRPPLRLDYGAGSLAIPARVRREAG